MHTLSKISSDSVSISIAITSSDLHGVMTADAIRKELKRATGQNFVTSELSRLTKETVLCPDSSK